MNFFLHAVKYGSVHVLIKNMKRAERKTIILKALFVAI